MYLSLHSFSTSSFCANFCAIVFICRMQLCTNKTEYNKNGIIDVHLPLPDSCYCKETEQSLSIYIIYLSFPSVISSAFVCSLSHEAGLKHNSKHHVRTASQLTNTVNINHHLCIHKHTFAYLLRSSSFCADAPCCALLSLFSCFADLAEDDLDDLLSLENLLGLIFKSSCLKYNLQIFKERVRRNSIQKASNWNAIDLFCN